MGTLKDDRLKIRAVRERWPMSATVRKAVLKRLGEIVGVGAKKGDEPSKPRSAVAASRALIQADRLNLEQQKFDHQTMAPAEVPGDDYIIDLGADDDTAANPPQPPA